MKDAENTFVFTGNKSVCTYVCVFFLLTDPDYLASLFSATDGC